MILDDQRPLVVEDHPAASPDRTPPPPSPAAPLLLTTLPSPVGVLTLVATAGHLVAVLWEDDRRRILSGPATVATDDPVLAAAATQLDEYFAGARRRFDLPLRFIGTPFQQSVWTQLLAIPFGETRSYGQIAHRLGRPTAARAVGAANGRNPLSIVAPCHRVVGSGGALTGFAGGLAAKRYLLALEAGA
jgi:methylated-DNA-[protein]-cysteine S-methyltransferase